MPAGTGGIALTASFPSLPYIIAYLDLLSYATGEVHANPWLRQMTMHRDTSAFALPGDAWLDEIPDDRRTASTPLACRVVPQGDRVGMGGRRGPARRPRTRAGPPVQKMRG